MWKNWDHYVEEREHVFVFVEFKLITNKQFSPYASQAYLATPFQEAYDPHYPRWDDKDKTKMHA